MPIKGNSPSTVPGTWDMQNRDPGLNFWDSWDEIPIGKDPNAPKQQTPAGGGVPIPSHTPPAATTTAPAGSLPALTNTAGGSTLGTTTAASTYSAKDLGGYAAVINAIIGAYGALKSHKPQTVNDPLNDALRARIYGFIDNSPTRNMLGGMLGDYIKGNANSTWTPPPAKYGYNPYPSGVPKYDLSGVLPMLQPPQPQPSGGGSGPDAPGGGEQRQLSASDIAQFQSFAQQYGQPAAHQVIAMLEQNPQVGVPGAIRTYLSQSGGQNGPV